MDGKELSRQTVEHTIPFLMARESFDIGIDTRTGVDDSYELPFPFTGNIDTLTYKLGPEQLGERMTIRPSNMRSPVPTTKGANDVSSAGIKGAAFPPLLRAEAAVRMGSFILFLTDAQRRENSNLRETHAADGDRINNRAKSAAISTFE